MILIDNANKSLLSGTNKLFMYNMNLCGNLGLRSPKTAITP